MDRFCCQPSELTENSCHPRRLVQVRALQTERRYTLRRADHHGSRFRALRADHRRGIECVPAVCDRRLRQYPSWTRSIDQEATDSQSRSGQRPAAAWRHSAPDGAAGCVGSDFGLGLTFFAEPPPPQTSFGQRQGYDQIREIPGSTSRAVLLIEPVIVSFFSYHSRRTIQCGWRNKDRRTINIVSMST